LPARAVGRFSALDAALLVMVIIWGANFSVIKYALREFSPVTFNALRLALATAVFLIAIAFLEREHTPFTPAEWKRVAFLGVVGHLLYQVAFLAGIARTSVSNSALIFGVTPVMVALLSAFAGHERVSRTRWFGAALSFLGIYIVVGRKASLGVETLRGDVLVFAGMLCWSIYSVVAQPLLRQHSPLRVTGYSLAIGSLLYLGAAIPSFASTAWATISATSWTLMALSSLLALAFAYMVWYTAVQRIGSARTAVYSNLTPIVAMTVAALWLDEPISVAQIVGAATILSGLFITRFAAPAAPSEA
jgi:drug/metabolite transporter (DMT)-like permease